SEASAAMGLTSLESLDDFVSANRRNYSHYHRLLRDLPGIAMRPPDAVQDTTCQYVVLDIDAERAGLSRDLALRVLTAEGVLVRPYFYPGCHRMEPYRSRQPDVELPATDRVCRGVLQLPTGTTVDSDDIERIGALLRFVWNNSRAIESRLAASGY